MVHLKVKFAAIISAFISSEIMNVRQIQSGGHVGCLEATCILFLPGTYCMKVTNIDQSL